MAENIFWYDQLKRALDLVAGLLLLAVTFPIQLVLAALIAIKLGGPVIFRQDRPGKDGELFTLYKFRSMANIDETRGLISDEDRLTRFGRGLRATSLDELPSLWNVVRGDMSLVGPRPLLLEYLAVYTPEQFRRHKVRPGVTGLAQVKGRNSISWSEKFDLDLYYVDHRSFYLDTLILLQTLGVVFRQYGISSRGHATMPKFGENRDD